MDVRTFVFYLLIIIVNNVCAYKILLVFPYPGKSHTILGEGYVRHLLNAGHEVTYITPVLIKKPHSKLRQVDISSNIGSFELNKVLDFKMVLSKEVDLTDMSIMYERMLLISNRSLTHENVQKFLMNTDEKFDLVVAAWMYNELYSGFAAIYNCPYVWFSTMEPHPIVLSLIDEIGNPAYFPDQMSIVSPPLTFLQRVAELWNIFYLYNIRGSLKDREEKIYKNAFEPAALKRGLKLPPFEVIKFNSSMIFGNSHISSGEAQRLPLNYIHISGYHIADEIPPLQENLQNIMDNAQYGVIYFSMGSMIKSKTMPLEFKRELLNMFSQLKQTVLWKLEEKLTNVPKNVHILQWAPQQSILAHPNCKLFITHGGLLSTTETLHFGVPIIGIPLFGDQFINVMRAVRKGFGLQVDLDYDTPAKLKVAIEEILGNPKYSKKVKELSFIFHHRPVKPGAELVHWIEHVIETRGAMHLRSPALHVPVYQKLFLDVIGLIILGTILVIITISKLIKLIISTEIKRKVS